MFILYKAPVDRNGNIKSLLVDDEKKTYELGMNIRVINAVQVRVRGVNDLRSIVSDLSFEGYDKTE